mgnify:CR=1 FL=1
MMPLPATPCVSGAEPRFCYGINFGNATPCVSGAEPQFLLWYQFRKCHAVRERSRASVSVMVSISEMPRRALSGAEENLQVVYAPVGLRESGAGQGSHQNDQNRRALTIFETVLTGGITF